MSYLTYWKHQSKSLMEKKLMWKRQLLNPIPLAHLRCEVEEVVLVVCEVLHVEEEVHLFCFSFIRSNLFLRSISFKDGEDGAVKAAMQREDMELDMQGDMEAATGGATGTEKVNLLKITNYLLRKCTSPSSLRVAILIFHLFVGYGYDYYGGGYDSYGAYGDYSYGGYG